MGWGGSGRLFEFFSLRGREVSWRWALIRGWVLIQINTVRIFLVSFSRHFGKQSLHFIEP